MVIQHFNRIIRNKWIWGVFAVVIGAFFAFDFLFTDLLSTERRRPAADTASTLGGEAIDEDLFFTLTEDIRGFGRNRDSRSKVSEVNGEAWEIYALMETAKKNGITATDEEIRNMIRNDRSFRTAGGFDFNLYQRVLRENSLSPERFEEYVGRRLTMMKMADSFASGTAVWASPMEINQAVYDMTDSFSVRIARFTQSPKEAAEVKVDDAAVETWYNENRASLELPERVKLRMVKYDATDAKLLARMTVTEDEMRDHYDVTISKYTSTDTNGVETVKKFEEVKAEVEKELRLIAAVQCLETNLNHRAYDIKAAEGSSRVDEIAKEDSNKVLVSDWFSISGGYQEGFMKRAETICPGARDFNDVVARLEIGNDTYRYEVVKSDKAVWLVEKAKVSPSHIPELKDAKDIIRPRVLRDAKAKAFKTKVEAVAAKGAAAVLASGNVSTNITFTVCDLKPGVFPDQYAVVRAVTKLDKGQVSDFTLTGTGKALLVVCEDRKSGDASKVQMMKLSVRNEVEMLQRRQIPEAWRKWNLDRLGFKAFGRTSIEDVSEVE